MKQALAILLSIIIAIYPPLAYASATSWTAQSVKQIGSKITIEAVKNNAKSVITTTASTGAVSRLLRGGVGQLALGFAIDKMLDATDWVLDPANNAVRYKTANAGWEYIIAGKSFDSVEQACKYVWSDSYLKTQGYKRARRTSGFNNVLPGDYYQAISWENSYSFSCSVNAQSISNNSLTYNYIKHISGRKLSTGTVDERSVSLDHVAEHVIANAAAGNVQSQQLVQSAIIEEVKAGKYDTQLKLVAVPINGEDGIGGVDGKDGEKGKDGKDAPKLDVSGIINAISSMANRITTTLGITNAKIDSVVMEQQDIKRVINTSTDTIIDIERETQARISDVVSSTDAVGAKVDEQGKLINDNIDQVIDEIKITGDLINTQTDAITTAIEGLDYGLSEDVINDAVDRVIQGQAEQSTVINEAVERILQEQAQKTAEQTKEITDAISNQTDVINDKSEANTDRIVDKLDEINDFIQDDEIVEDSAEIDVDVEYDKSPADFDRSYISLGDTCPSGFSFTVSILGISETVELSMQPACDFASAVRPAIQFLGAYVALGIISSAIRETA